MRVLLGDRRAPSVEQAPILVHQQPVDLWSIELHIEGLVRHSGEEYEHRPKLMADA